MTRAYLAFTAKGLALAQKLAAAYPGSVTRCGHEAGQVHLADWTARQFAGSDALVFVGAVGIAVRAIAPHCQSKAQDPAVVVLDECGRFAVPILSGHLGGANDLARALAAVCGAVPVITTATDANGVFAVDEWAKHQNCTVLEPERIKLVSGALLAGKTVQFASDWPIAGAPPDGITAGETRTLPLPSARRGMRCIWCRASACWAWAANAAPAPKRWPKPLQLSVPRTALRRNASRRRQAST